MRRTKWVSAILVVSMVFASLTGTVFAAEDPTVPDETGMVFAVEDLPEDEGLEKDEDLTNNQPADVEETTDDSIQLLNEPVELKTEYHSDYTVEFNGFEHGSTYSLCGMERNRGPIWHIKQWKLLSNCL